MTLTKMQVYHGALETIPNAPNISMACMIPIQTKQKQLSTMKGCYSFSIDNSGSHEFSCCCNK